MLQTGTPAAPCPACVTYYHNSAGRTNLIEDVSLDRPESSRTIRLNTAGRGQLYLVIFYTYSTATQVVVQLNCSIDGTTSIPRPVEKLETEGRNQRYLLSYDVSGCKSTSVVFGGSNDANSADVITVQAVGQAADEPQKNLPVQ
jgi:hypothetical protein